MVSKLVTVDTIIRRHQAPKLLLKPSSPIRYSKWLVFKRKRDKRPSIVNTKKKWVNRWLKHAFRSSVQDSFLLLRLLWSKSRICLLIHRCKLSTCSWGCDRNCKQQCPNMLISTLAKCTDWSNEGYKKKSEKCKKECGIGRINYANIRR